jgi:hypothetical protein
MDVCVVFVERTVAWNVKSDMMDEKDLNSTKMDQRGKTRTDKKKKNPVGGKFSAPVQTNPGDHPASGAIGTGSLSRG